MLLVFQQSSAFSLEIRVSWGVIEITLNQLNNSSLDVGKTSILLRFVENTFTFSTVTTLGVDFRVKELEIEGQRIKLQVNPYF